MRTRGRIDNNHREIVEALRSTGWQFISTAGVGGGAPDGLALRRGKLLLVEFKGPKGKLTPAQLALVKAGWPIRVIRSVDEALGL